MAVSIHAAQHPPDVGDKWEQLPLAALRRSATDAQVLIAANCAKYGRDQAETCLTVWWGANGKREDALPCDAESELIDTPHTDGTYWCQILPRPVEERPPEPEGDSEGEDGGDKPPSKKPKKDVALTLAVYRYAVVQPAPVKSADGTAQKPGVRDWSAVYARTIADLEGQVARRGNEITETNKEIDKLRKALRDKEDETARLARELESTKAALEASRENEGPLVPQEAIAQTIDLYAQYLGIDANVGTIINGEFEWLNTLSRESPDVFAKLARDMPDAWNTKAKVLNDNLTRMGVKDGLLPTATEIVERYHAQIVDEFQRTVVAYQQTQAAVAAASKHPPPKLMVQHEYLTELVEELGEKLQEHGIDPAQALGLPLPGASAAQGHGANAEEDEGTEPQDEAEIEAHTPKPTKARTKPQARRVAPQPKKRTPKRQVQAQTQVKGAKARPKAPVTKPASHGQKLTSQSQKLVQVMRDGGRVVRANGKSVCRT